MNTQASQHPRSHLHAFMPNNMSDTQRILDANCNRACEGLRVVEEFARFVLNDQTLTTAFKGIRHELAATIQKNAPNCAEFRDTLGDVGTTVTTAGESYRSDAQHVAAANLQRIQQSLRCLEEYGKLVSPQLGGNVERLRYQVYTLQTALLRSNRRDIEACKLYVLTDLADCEDDFNARIALWIEQGVHIIQLRDKSAADRLLVDRARLALQQTRQSETRLIINDRADIAAVTQADGVHVGQDELSVADARRIVGSGPLVGVSTHTVDQVQQAVLDGADYIGCGPTFVSQTKSFDAFSGLEFLQAANRLTSLPAFAIGGITLRNVDLVLEAGFTRIAAQGEIQYADDPADVIGQFRQKLGS